MNRGSRSDRARTSAMRSSGTGGASVDVMADLFPDDDGTGARYKSLYGANNQLHATRSVMCATSVPPPGWDPVRQGQLSASRDQRGTEPDRERALRRPPGTAR